MPPQTFHDDAWLAVQYVLGELPADSCAEFEARLADDPVLCQHVADAARLVATTSASFATRVPTLVAKPVPVQSRRHLAAFIAVAATALCLVLAVLPRDEHRSRDQGAAAKLVSLWRTNTDPFLTGTDDLDLADDHAEWSSDQVPSWMIAAVSLDRHQQAPGERRPEDKWEEN